MTATLVRPPAATPVVSATPVPAPLLRGPIARLRRPRPSRDWFWKPWSWRLFLGVVTLATFGAHVYRVGQSIDLFIDEPFYAEVGQSIARGGMPYATGSYFFLHPPGFFVVEAGWMHLFGTHSEVFAQVLSLRKLIAVISALTALMLALVVERAVGRTAAAVVALFYMMNTFANQQSSMVLLEPVTLFWTLAGYAVFVRLREPGSRARQRQIALAGLLFGFACLSKEFAVFVTLVPLGLAWILRCWITRREAVRAMMWTAVPWAVWMVIVVATGHLGQFAGQVTAGFHRTAGSTQISGFNAPGAPSFVDTIVSNLAFLWTAYAILGFGTIAIVYLAVTSTQDQRLRFLSLFGVGAIPLLMYCVTLGTNEEQFFNFLFFPGLICLVAVVWLKWRTFSGRARTLVLLLVAAAVVSDYSMYALMHIQPDDGTYQVDKWMYAHVPDGTRVAVTNPVQREIFLRYDMVDDVPGKRLGPAVEYLVVFWKQVDQGYASADPATVHRQVAGLRPVFETTDRSNGRMAVYALR